MLNYLSRTKLKGLWFAFLIYIYRREGVNHVLGPARQEAAGAEPRKQNLVVAGAPPGVRVRARGAPALLRVAGVPLKRGAGWPVALPRARRRDSVNHRLPRGPRARASRVSAWGTRCVLRCGVARLPDREVLRGPRPWHCRRGPWSLLVAGAGGAMAFLLDIEPAQAPRAAGRRGHARRPRGGRAPRAGGQGRGQAGARRASTSFSAVSFPARAAPARWRGRPGHGALRPGGRGAPEIAARCRTCLMCPEIDCEHSKQWCDMIILTVCG